MSAKESTTKLFHRYVWLTNLIYKWEYISFKEINNQWINSALNDSGLPFPKKTFRNHITAIWDMFHIDIACCKKGNYTYYINNSESLKSGDARKWMIDSISINNLIHESQEVQENIIFENNPSSERFLTTVIEAIRDKNILEITYQKHTEDEAKTFKIEPYCVKIFKQRWYVMGKNCHGKLRTYSLGIRMLNVKPTQDKYQIPDDFKGENYFSDCYGVTVNKDKTPELIEIKAYDVKAKYIRSLPLHDSQKEIEKNDEYSVFTFFLTPSYEFEQELLAQSDLLEVLSPKWLREKMIKTLKKIVARYEN